MKRKTFMMLFALSMGTTAFAQTGLASGTRFGHGEDSLNCLKNISIYTEYVKTNNFKDAYTPWKAVFTEAPIAQVSTYTNGAKILRGLIASTGFCRAITRAAASDSQHQHCRQQKT